MLVALNSSGTRCEASRDLPADQYWCAVCEHPAVFKPGRIRIPHFAHAVGIDCLASEPEGPAHLAAKRTLAERFRALGYDVTLEETYVGVGRRIDLVVRLSGGSGIAVEVQDSKISADEIRARNRIDRRLGMEATIWVFTGTRAPWAAAGGEARIPDEVLYLENTHRNGVFVLDGDDMLHCRFDTVYREGSTSEWYEPGGVLASEEYPGRTPKTIRFVTTTPATFVIEPFEGRFGVTAAFRTA